MLDGPTAIAFVGDGDMVAVAKALSDTARQTKILAIKGGILQGAPDRTPRRCEDLASLPPARCAPRTGLGAIVGPLNAIVGLVNAPLPIRRAARRPGIDQLQSQRTRKTRQEA